MLNKLTDAELGLLRDIAGSGRVATGEEIGADYGHDELPLGAAHLPEAVVEAESTEQVAAVLKLCREAGVPVTVRGAGTGQAGGSVPLCGGVVLSVKGMNRILALDEAAKTVTVQPGVLLQEVKAEAEKHGLYYPPDPGEKTATIGGNVSTDAGGPCAVKYGKTKDYVLDAVIVKTDGTAARLSDDPANAAVVGSEGTLAVVTEVTLRLVDKPGADAILLFPMMDMDSAIAAAQKLLASDFDPAVVELMDTDLVEFSGNVTGNPVFPVELDGERVGATLMVTLEAEDDDAVMEKMETVAEMAEELECLDILVGDSPTMKREFWDAHTAFHTSMESGAKNAFEINVDLPFEAIGEIIAYAKATGEAAGLRVMVNAHVGSGGVHLHAVSDTDRESFAAAVKGFADAVYAKVAALGGDIAGEYGVGYAKTAYLSEEAKAKFSALKAAFDPDGILNPGKIV